MQQVGGQGWVWVVSQGGVRMDTGGQLVTGDGVTRCLGAWVPRCLADGLLVPLGRWDITSGPDDIALIGAVGWPAIAAGYLLARSILQWTLVSCKPVKKKQKNK